MTLDLRAVPTTGRKIRPTDDAFGFDGSLTSATAARRSSWKEALELSGVHVQFSTDGSTWSDDTSDADTHYRLATGTEKPADDSDRWTAGIALGSGSTDISFSDISGTIADAQIPSAIMRDSEFTAAAVRTLLSLSSTEVNDLLTGASLSGSTLTFTQNDGTTVTITLPAAGESVADGVVESGAFNDDQTELVLTLDTGGTVTVNVPEALRIGTRFIDPNSDGTLPDAADNQGKFVVSGNFLFESIDHGGHDKEVEFSPYGPNRTEPPTRSTNENNYGGSFEFPPHDDIGDYDTNTILWDRGSEVWLIKPSSSATRWSSYSGPLYWHHGNIYADRATAFRHVSSADDVGARIVIFGYGSTQKPYMVTALHGAHGRRLAVGPDWRDHRGRGQPHC